MKKPKQYCYTCGFLLNVEHRGQTYNNDTGKPYDYWKYKCQENVGKWFWQKHRIWEPVMDY